MTDAIYIIVFVAVTLLVAAWFRSYQNQRQKKSVAEENATDTNAEDTNTQQRAKTMNTPTTNPYEGMTQRELLMTVLKELNCQPEEDETEPDRILVAYQGERFIIDYSEQSKYISIHDVWWYNAPLDDIELLSDIRKVVNACNFDNHTTLIYTINTEENVIGVHTRQSMIFVPEIHNLRDYLASQFLDSFRQHQNFFSRLNSLKEHTVPKEN
ncbi:MAG: hypothetical protein IKX61_07870 [Prevotella sp.]|nr:hypothetical protein [Prevotella sp.]